MIIGTDATSANSTANTYSATYERNVYFKSEALFLEFVNLTLSNKMNCTVRFGNCFIRVPLIY